MLVTGAGGCIGSWTLALLENADVEVHAIDLQIDKRRPGLLMDNAALDRVVWHAGDIADTQAVKEVVKKSGAQAIIHLAALQVPFCRADPVAGALVNVVGTVNVFEAAKACGVQRLTYASSVAATGHWTTVAPCLPCMALINIATNKRPRCIRKKTDCTVSGFALAWCMASAETKA